MRNLVLLFPSCRMFHAAAPAYAAVPETISSQGYLTDAAGNPVSGTVTVTFRL